MISNGSCRTQLSMGRVSGLLSVPALNDREWVYSVEEVGSGIVLATRGDQHERVFCRSGRRWLGHRDDLGHFAEVLGSCGEVELVSCAIWPAQAQAIQLQDALEVGEQHLDLLALAS